MIITSNTFRAIRAMNITALSLSMLITLALSGVVSGQQKPTAGYAPVNGLKMYYEIRGQGEPVVMLHGAFMTITAWNEWVDDLAKTRKVIAVEMQGHGRTADIDRDTTAENLSDDVAALLEYLKSRTQTSLATAWAPVSRCSVRSVIRRKCERS